MASAALLRLSELVRQAQKQPQQLTSHGEVVAFIRRSPLVEAEALVLERCPGLPRDGDP
ncbi:MAG: hypothetical protein KME02_12540 [Aphanothece saxicola GSE-SYN-MK-01-06B]|jgi:hypothetical protein|nr:hypothetical protein [Aphanothece saxicola GSE-SYN-MK-01-06B]